MTLNGMGFCMFWVELVQHKSSFRHTTHISWHTTYFLAQLRRAAYRPGLPKTNIGYINRLNRQLEQNQIVVVKKRTNN